MFLSLYEKQQGGNMFERTNVPSSSQRTWTLFHMPPIFRLNVTGTEQGPSIKTRAPKMLKTIK